MIQVQGKTFLDIVQLLAKYDHVLQELLSNPKRQINYTSPKKKLIAVLDQKLETAMINEIISSAFYYINFDTTEDISKTNQLCELKRYCVIKKDKNRTPIALVIKELSLGFHKVRNQTALTISNQIMTSKMTTIFL